MAGPIHSIHDTDVRFIIDPISRTAKNETLKKVNLVIKEHNSEIFSFELPRTIEGHDMAECNKVEVHYANTHHTTKEKSADIYKVADYAVDPSDPEKVTFSWIISNKATKFPGPLSFALHFFCVDDLTDKEFYRWSTTTNNTITVLDSIDLTPEEGEETTTDLQEKTTTPTKDVQVVRPDGEFRGLSKVVVNPIPEEFTIPSGSLFVNANGDYEVRELDKIMVRVPDVPAVLQEKEITENGTYTPDKGVEGFSQVTVNVPDVPPELQEKTAEPSAFEQIIEPDEDFDGLSKVTVGPVKLQSKEAKENGEITPDEGFHGLESITVNVEPRLQEKTATGNGVIFPDADFDGLSRVTVDIPEEVPTYQHKTVEENGTHYPDAGFDALSGVTVNVPIPDGYIKPSGTQNIIENGEHDVRAFEAVNVAVPVPDGYIKPSGEKSITSNGTHDVGAFETVDVNVPTPEPRLQTKTVEITENGPTLIEADDGFDGLSSVVVDADVPTPAPVLQEKTTTENGVVLPDDGFDGLSSVTVNVPDAAAVLQEKTAEVNGEVTPDEGYDGLSKVTVKVPIYAQEYRTLKVGESVSYEHGGASSGYGMNTLGVVECTDENGVLTVTAVAVGYVELAFLMEKGEYYNRPYIVTLYITVEEAETGGSGGSSGNAMYWRVEANTFLRIDDTLPTITTSAKGSVT